MNIGTNSVKNIYAAARESIGYTQERASELIPVSVRALSDYETGKTTPPLDVVDRMCRVYKDGRLFFEHYTALRLSNGHMFQITTENLAEAALETFASLDELSELRCEITRIAKDGSIGDDERGDWETIDKKLAELMSAVLSLKLCGEYDAGCDNRKER